MKSWIKKLYRKVSGWFKAKVARQVNIKKIILDDGEEILDLPFQLPTEPSKELKFVREALRHVGITEDTPNYSPALVKLLKGRTFWRPGEAWCMYSINAIGILAFGKDWTLGKGGGTQVVYNEQVQKGRVSQVPHFGDLITFQNKSDSWHGHVGIILHIIDSKWCYTWEGNAGNKSGVFKRNYKTAYIGKRVRGFIDPFVGMR